MVVKVLHVLQHLGGIVVDLKAVKLVFARFASHPERFFFVGTTHVLVDCGTHSKKPGRKRNSTKADDLPEG